MSEADKHYIQYLMETDDSYKYIARDRNGSLWVFKTKPEKVDGLWRITDDTTYFQIMPSKSIMQFIEAEDTKPVSTEYLYKYIKGELDENRWYSSNSDIPRESREQDWSVDVLCQTMDNSICIGYRLYNGVWYNRTSGKRIQVVQWKYIGNGIDVGDMQAD